MKYITLITVLLSIFGCSYSDSNSQSIGDEAETSSIQMLSLDNATVTKTTSNSGDILEEYGDTKLFYHLTDQQKVVAFELSSDSSIIDINGTLIEFHPTTSQTDIDRWIELQNLPLIDTNLANNIPEPQQLISLPKDATSINFVELTDTVTGLANGEYHQYNVQLHIRPIAISAGDSISFEELITEATVYEKITDIDFDEFQSTVIDVDGKGSNALSTILGFKAGDVVTHINGLTIQEFITQNDLSSLDSLSILEITFEDGRILKISNVHKF